MISRGGLVAYPTDTVYGLGCDPSNEAAVRRLFEAKGRGAKPVPVLCWSRSSAESVVDLGETGRLLANMFWPGALTIVAPLKKALPDLLHQGTGTLGVRVPASEVCMGVLEGCGGILTGTSANKSGSPPARSADEVFREVGSSVDLIIDGGLVQGKSSTVASVAGGRVTILRTGPVRVPEELMRRRT